MAKTVLTFGKQEFGQCFPGHLGIQSLSPAFLDIMYCSAQHNDLSLRFWLEIAAPLGIFPCMLLSPSTPPPTPPPTPAPGGLVIEQTNMAAPLKIMNNKGLVLGVYEAETKGDPVDVASSPSAAYFNKQTDGQLASYDITAVCCLGKRGTRYSKQEGFEEGWENIRAAVAGGVRALRSVGETQVDVDPCLMAEAAAEGGHLALFEYDELKNPEKRKKRVSLACLTQHMTASDPASVENVSSLWQRGCGKAEGQNLARHLMEAPSNKLTPRAFTELVQAKFANRPNVKGWYFHQAVSQYGPDAGRHGWGSLCAFIPLCENMPGGAAIKPGDVVTARNGKSIQIDNTDAEGRLILADALSYAETVNPCLILDMATLTGAIDVALGSAATGVFAKSTETFNTLQKAGSRTGDRMWRMPLFSHYSGQVTDCQLADVNNVGKYSRSGGSCTAAAFLKEFVTHEDWLHLDIAGVMSNKDEVPYLGKGMAGRPTRTIVEFIHMISSS
ncbi:AMPL-like protein [Mya arenaria]|uniref:AMPL-like protein n=1 Tax=Mya arenaria TaxID=6604 RepID=A0ABY7FFC3_MYAAR|nr:AMPL-like protein [Mya arenaria]